MVVHGVEGVFDQRGPDLVELAAVGADRGQEGIEVGLDGDVLQAGAEHGEGVFERLGDVDVLHGRLVHVGVVLDGADEIEDADGGVEDGLGDALDAQGAGEGGEGGGDDFVGEGGGELVEVGEGDAGFGERGGDVPGVGDLFGLEPAEDGLFAVGLGHGVERLGGLVESSRRAGRGCFSIQALRAEECCWERQRAPRA